MPRPRLLLVIAAVAAIATLALTTRATPPKLGPTPVIVELFTSQGCSSCPPADALIHEITSDPGLRGRVIPLAFHVDYWDRLGWRDPFSSAEWSQRQVRYARTMHIASAYTPQAIVNGFTQLVGSNRGALNGAIERASNRATQGSIKLALRLDHDALVAGITATVPSSDEILLAITEGGLTTRIEHGENAGRTVINDAIVRRLVRAKVGETRIPLDPRWRNVDAVAFLQNRDTLAIDAADSASLTPR